MGPTASASVVQKILLMTKSSYSNESVKTRTTKLSSPPQNVARLMQMISLFSTIPIMAQFSSMTSAVILIGGKDRAFR